MRFDPAGLPGLLRRSAYMEVLYHVCLAAGAESPVPAGRQEFLAGVRETLALDRWQRSMLRELATRNRVVLDHLVCRLARRHAALVARLEQGGEADRAAADLEAGLDAVVATTLSVTKVLASYLRAGQLMGVCRGGSGDAHTWSRAEWIRSILDLVEAAGAPDGETGTPPDSLTPLRTLVPEVILHTRRRQAPFLTPVSSPPWMRSPQALWAWLTGLDTPHSSPPHCSLAASIPLFLLVPDLLPTNPLPTETPTIPP